MTDKEVLKAQFNLDKFTQIYGEGEEQNPIPKNCKTIVYYSNDKDVEGLAEVSNPDELGLEQLIAKSWITRKDFDLL